MNFYKMTTQAVAPKKATAGSACYDLYSCVGPDGLTINPGARMAIPTGIVLEIPEQHVVKVFARSGLSYKKGITLANCVGIIDHDYREELYVLLRNDSLESYKIEHGDRIAQMMLEKVLNYELLEIDARPAILETRDGGMGSTGKK